jgi:hypothetical protein
MTTRRRRTPGRRDERGSLTFAMLLTLLAVSASTLLLPIIVNEFEATRVEVRRDNALNAAQAGLDVALAHIRSARDTDGDGDEELAELCIPTLRGDVVTAGGTAGYVADITYVLPDATTVTGCPPRTPVTAELRSVGTSDGVNRTLRETYTLQTNNQNIAGGLIRVFRTATSVNDMCLDAGSGNPIANTPVRMEVCDAENVAQRFGYTGAEPFTSTLPLTGPLAIVLMSSVTLANPNGMCLYVNTPQGLNDTVRFQQCLPPSATSLVRAKQMWSINTSSNFEGTDLGVTLNGYCFNVQNPDVPGSLVILGRSPNCQGSPNNRNGFSPDASVGAGAAGADNGQLVNYDQFGRCLDVTELNVNYFYMISWPCKQTPNPANLDWNQLWALPDIDADADGVAGRETGAITVQPTTGQRYCLRSPGSTDPSWHVVLQACPGATNAPHLQWTVYGDTGVYATSYRIVDYQGYCLQPTDPDEIPPDLYPSGNEISKIVVRECSSSTLQKWNAPPGQLEALPVTDIYEE